MEKKAMIGIGVVVLVIAGFIGGYALLSKPIVITVKGSTTVQPVITKIAEAYMDENVLKKYDIQVSGGGSSVGVASAGNGTADIGMSSRDVKQSELDQFQGMKVIPIAKDGIAIISNLDVNVTTLTLTELKSIYNGSITNWNQLGGPDKAIVVIGRDSASGTREFFYEHVMLKTNFTTSMIEANSNGMVKQQVISNPGSIGFVGLGYISNETRTIAIKANSTADAIIPSIQSVKNDTYSISRSLYLLTMGEPQGEIKAFIDYVLSAKGQQIVEQEGFVSVI